MVASERIILFMKTGKKDNVATYKWGPCASAKEGQRCTAILQKGEGEQPSSRVGLRAGLL